MDDLQDVITIKNGEHVQNTFSHAEFARRTSSLRAKMAERDINAALFTSYHNINYYADFLYYQFGRPYGLVVDHDNLTSVSANIDGAQPWRRTVGDNVIYTDWKRDNYFRALQQLMPAKGRVGVEYDHMPLQTMEKLRAAFPGVEFVDIAEDCMQMRMIKSDEEIALIKHGANVADIGGAACARGCI